MLTIGLGILLVTLIIYVVHLAHDLNQYWKRRGLKHMKPVLFFGNSLPVFLRRKHICIVYHELCQRFPNEPLLGFYDTMTPRVIVQDADYIEKIFVKDFQHFTDHGFAFPDEKTDPIDHYNLFVLRGAKWRAYRYKMSPLFSSGKLKQFSAMLDLCGDRIVKHIEKGPKTDVNIQDSMLLFLIDFVGMAVFGFDAGAIDNPDSEFHKLGKDILNIGFVKEFFLVMAPRLGERLGVSFGKARVIAYICKIIREAFEHRQRTGTQRNDFIQMMLHLKEQGRIAKPDLGEEESPGAETFELTDESLMAQAYSFMTTGLDTVSTATTFCLFELSLHPDVQEKARAEVQRQTAQHGGFTYEALKSMTYLGNVVSESARLHPVVLAILRVCTKDYEFPNGYQAKVGDMLHIPSHAVHLNPRYHPEPLEFRPERFETPMRPGTYFPFGEGPRTCVAMRFAQLQVKYAVGKMLSHYRIQLSKRTKLPLDYKPGTVIVQPRETLYFDLDPVK